MWMQLTLLTDDESGQGISFSDSGCLVGRADECDLRPRSKFVSRLHCLISMENGRAVIEDLGSRNGTFVNDERVLYPRELQVGDILGIGHVQYRLGSLVGISGKEDQGALRQAQPA